MNMNTIKMFEDFTSRKVESSLKEKLNEAICDMIAANLKRGAWNGNLPCECTHIPVKNGSKWAIFIPFDCSDGEFHFTANENKFKEFNDDVINDFILTYIYIYIFTEETPMRVSFHAEVKFEDGETDGADFEFEDIVEQEDLIEFIDED